jgi:hypothetical protein
MPDFKEDDKVSFVPHSNLKSDKTRSVGYIMYVEPEKNRAKIVMRKPWQKGNLGNRPRFFKNLDELQLEPPDEIPGTEESRRPTESGRGFRVRPS